MMYAMRIFYSRWQSRALCCALCCRQQLLVIVGRRVASANTSQLHAGAFGFAMRGFSGSYHLLQTFHDSRWRDASRKGVEIPTLCAQPLGRPACSELNPISSSGLSFSQKVLAITRHCAANTSIREVQGCCRTKFCRYMMNHGSLDLFAFCVHVCAS